MNKRPGKVKVRIFGSNNGRRRIGQAGAWVSLGKDGVVKRNARTGRIMGVGNVISRHPQGVRVFVGPSVEGADVEYIEIVSGKVSDRKPSFAR
jgi:hypothetical protein